MANFIKRELRERNLEERWRNGTGNSIDVSHTLSRHGPTALQSQLFS